MPCTPFDYNEAGMTRPPWTQTTTVLGMLFLAACSGGPEVKKAAEEPQPKAPAVEETTAAKTLKARFETTKGPVVVEIRPDWAPLGAARFEQLVKDSYYDNAGFFRIVPGFVVQFGIAATPAMTKKWDKAIKDDPVKQSNAYGSVTFATSGPNTRTAQLFINLRDNRMLDSQGFAPFGRVVEGMEVVEKLYAGYGENPDQDQITKRGNKYLEEKFPNLDYIKKATIE